MSGKNDNLITSQYGVMVKDVQRAIDDNADEIQHFLDSLAQQPSKKWEKG